MTSDLSRIAALAATLLALSVGEAGSKDVRNVQATCSFQPLGSFAAAASGNRLTVSNQGAQFFSSTSQARLTIQSNYRISQVLVTDLTSLDFYRDVLSLHPSVFDEVRLPTCVMVIHKGAHRVGLLPIGRGVLFVEVSAHDPPTAQVYLAQ